MTINKSILQSPELTCNYAGQERVSELRTFLIVSAALYLAAIFVPTATADLVTVTGDIAAGSGQITINNDLTFNINTAGNVLTLVFDEWTTSDGSATLALIAGNASVFGYRVNGGVTSTTNTKFRDNFDGTLGDITPNDGYLTFETLPAVSIGDTFTVNAGTYAVDAAPGFNPALNNSTFRGSTFLTNTAGIRISNIVVGIPEPASSLLLGLGSFGWLTRRGKK